MNATEAMERTKQGLESLKNNEYENIIDAISYASENGYTSIPLYEPLQEHTIDKLEAEGYCVGARRFFLFSKQGYISWNGKLNDVSTYVIIAQCWVFIFMIYGLYLAVASIVTINPH